LLKLFKIFIYIFLLITILSCSVNDSDAIDGKAVCIELQTIMYLRTQEIAIKNNRTSPFDPIGSILPFSLCTSDTILGINTIYSEKEVKKCKNLLLVFPFQNESDAYLTYLYYLAPELCGLNKNNLFKTSPSIKLKSDNF
jgi:hypothetical protein